MTPGRDDLLIILGSGLERSFTYLDAAGQPVDLTNYHARAGIKKYADSTDFLLQLSDATGEIALNSTGGIVMRISAAASILVPLSDPMSYGPFPAKGTCRVPPGAYSGKLAVWDLKLFPPLGEPFTLLQGIACFVREASSPIISAS